MKKRIISMILIAALAVMSAFCLAEAPAREKPWINSSIIGAVTEDYDPSLRDDFFVAVNREYLMNAEILPGYDSANMFNELANELLGRAQGLLTDETVTGHEADLVRNAYALWLDWDARNAPEYTETIAGYIKAVEAIDSLDALSAYLASEECRLRVDYPVAFYYDSDAKDASLTMLVIVPGLLSLSDSGEYAQRTASGDRDKKLFDATLRHVLGKMGYDDAAIEGIIERSMAFETAIAPAVLTYAEVHAPGASSKLYHPVTIEALGEMSPDFPIADMIRSAGCDVAGVINLQQPDWLVALNAMYTEENLENIKAYLIGRIVKKYESLVSEDVYRKIEDDKLAIKGVKPASDADSAYKFVHRQLTEPFSKIYAEKYLPESVREDVLAMIADIVDYYRTMLAGEDWLSPETREEAIDKLDHMRCYAAYPSEWSDFSALSIGTAEAGETLLSAQEKIDRFANAQFIDRLGKPFDAEHDIMADCLTVNAYYNPGSNSMHIIGGILGGAFYDPARSRSENLGAIGVVIGHEISHAFDSNGALFDRDGNLNDWWTEADYAAFSARNDRMADYFGSIEYDTDGKTYNGQMMSGECNADLAGVKAAYGVASQAEDFDAKAFFESYAHMWCGVILKSRADSLLVGDVHAPLHVRVNGVLQQFAEFMEAYDIKPGDGMYRAPEDSVVIW